MFKVPEEYRILSGLLSSSKEDGNNGVFLIPNYISKLGNISVIASEGCAPDSSESWEHVSVSLMHRCPNWYEMCSIKSVFWDDDDVVMQIHPAKKDWVNNHQYCLHLWRPIDQEIPLPPKIGQEIPLPPKIMV